MPSKPSLELMALKPGDRVTGLKSGKAEFQPLKSFLQKDVKRFQETSLARTYVVREQRNTQTVAYVTLVCGEIEAKGGESLVGDGVNFPYPTYPAVKIERLLVDARHRGLGISKKLVEFSLGLARQKICPNVGCRFVVLDAKRESVDFYEKQGFKLINTTTNRRRPQPIMFLDLHKVS